MIAQSADNTLPEAFLEYEGVKVYHTYRFDDPSNYLPSSHIFTAFGSKDHRMGAKRLT